MTIDVATACWVLGGLTSIISILIGVIWNSVQKQIKENHESTTKVHARVDDEIRERVTKHDEMGKRFFDELHQVSNSVHDLDVTVAGFGGTYATRSEMSELRKEMNRKE